MMMSRRSPERPADTYLSQIDVTNAENASAKTHKTH